MNVDEMKTTSPGEEEIHGDFLSARDALDRGDLEKAQEIYRKLARQLPGSSEAALGLARCAYLREDIHLCADEYQRALQLESSLGVFHRIYHLAPRDISRMLSLTVALKDRGLWEEALSFTDRLVEMKMSPEKRQEMLTLREEVSRMVQTRQEENRDQSLIDSGRRMGKFATAVSVVIVLILLAGAGLYIFMISRINIKAGLEALDQAEIMREHFLATEQGGDRVIAKLHQAERIFTRVTQTDSPEKAMAHYYLGITSRSLANMYQLLDPEKNKEIIEEYRQKTIGEFTSATEADNKLAEARLELAQIFIRQGNREQAIQEVQKAREIADGLSEPFQSRQEQIRSRAARLAEEIEKIPHPPEDENQQNQVILEPGPTPELIPVHEEEEGS